MGGFRNRRQEYSWEGETLELDETYFDHGTLYEIECETVRRRAHGAGGLAGLVWPGEFCNRRQKYSWEGETLDLDETYFDHGMLYEIE